jgi:hypothetical protein
MLQHHPLFDRSFLSAPQSRATALEPLPLNGIAASAPPRL